MILDYESMEGTLSYFIDNGIDLKSNYANALNRFGNDTKLMLDSITKVFQIVNQINIIILSQ